MNQNSTNNVQNKSENCEDTHVPETQFVSLIVRDGQWVEPTQSSNEHQTPSKTFQNIYLCKCSIICQLKGVKDWQNFPKKWYIFPEENCQFTCRQCLESYQELQI